MLGNLWFIVLATITIGITYFLIITLKKQYDLRKRESVMLLRRMQSQIVDVMRRSSLRTEKNLSIGKKSLNYFRNKSVNSFGNRRGSSF